MRPHTESMVEKMGWLSHEEKQAHELYLLGSPERESQFNLMADQLCNNDSCEDEELFNYFIESGIEYNIAKRALELRDLFLTNPFAQLCYRNEILDIRYLRLGTK